MRRTTLDDAVMHAASEARKLLEDRKVTTVERHAAYQFLRSTERYCQEVGYEHIHRISKMLRTYEEESEWKKTVRGILGSLEDD